MFHIKALIWYDLKYYEQSCYQKTVSIAEVNAYFLQLAIITTPHTYHFRQNNINSCLG